MWSKIEYKKRYHALHREEHRAYYSTPFWRMWKRLYTAEERHLQKVRVLSRYSNPKGSLICNNCGEQDIDTLCLDHIDGGGNKYDRQLSGTLYSWVEKNQFPKGFQVLCANCNLRKSFMEMGNNRKVKESLGSKADCNWNCQN